MNGLYDSGTIIFLFPLIVYLGASGDEKETISSRTSNFLGEISYPIYIIHYPFTYLYKAWVDKQKPSTGQSVAGGIVVLLPAIMVAYLCARFYDIPVRKWLTQRFMSRRVKEG